MLPTKGLIGAGAGSRLQAGGALLAVAALGWSASSFAQVHFNEKYYQFRSTCGLPGNMYGVNNDGDIGFAGAMSECIPVGYTPSNSSWAAGVVWAQSIKGEFHLGVSGHGIDDTATACFGVGSKGHGVALIWTGVDQIPGKVVSIQGQPISETRKRPAVSVGVLDIIRERDPVRDLPPRVKGDRSFYIAATKRLGGPHNPVHATVGFGTARFNNGPFFGVCWDVRRRIKLIGEYDGYKWNAAIAGDLLGTREHSLVLFLGAEWLNRPVIGVTYAH